MPAVAESGSKAVATATARHIRSMPIRLMQTDPRADRLSRRLVLLDSTCAAPCPPWLSHWQAFFLEMLWREMDPGGGDRRSRRQPRSDFPGRDRERPPAIAKRHSEKRGT